VSVDGIRYEGDTEFDQALMAEMEGQQVHVKLKTHWGTKAWVSLKKGETNPMSLAALSAVPFERTSPFQTRGKQTLVILENTV
jgi:hypothetical protein